MKKFWCKHFVPVGYLDKGRRQEAANWAFDRFDSKDIDIFYKGPNNEDGFWFAKEHDALLFAIRWSS